MIRKLIYQFWAPQMWVSKLNIVLEKKKNKYNILKFKTNGKEKRNKNVFYFTF